MDIVRSGCWLRFPSFSSSTRRKMQFSPCFLLHQDKILGLDRARWNWPNRIRIFDYRISDAISNYEIQWKLARLDRNIRLPIIRSISYNEIRWKYAEPEPKYPASGYPMHFYTMKSSGNWRDRNPNILLTDIRCTFILKNPIKLAWPDPVTV